MSLSISEIEFQTVSFSRDGDGAKAKRAEARTFWSEFFSPEEMK